MMISANAIMTSSYDYGEVSRSIVIANCVDKQTAIPMANNVLSAAEALRR